MNAGLILGAVALAGMAMAAIQGVRGEVYVAPPPEFTGDEPVEPPPEIITEPPPPPPPGGKYELVTVGDLSIEMIGG